MRQDEFEEFDDSGPHRPRRRRGRRIVLTLLFLIAVGLATSVGYSLGRGSLALPDSVAANIPPPLSSWLPRSGKLSKSMGTPDDLNDYTFELVEGEMKQGVVIIDVRLVHRRSGQAVPDAVVFASRLDMAPDGMPTMATPLEQQASPAPGLYRFRADLTMDGAWQLSLAAKVQGETGTVQNKLVLRVAP